MQGRPPITYGEVPDVKPVERPEGVDAQQHPEEPVVVLESEEPMLDDDGESEDKPKATVKKSRAARAPGVPGGAKKR